MKNDITGMLNLAYEIEGLLLLQINRGDEAAPEMKELLVRKVKDLYDGLTGGDVIIPMDCVAEKETPITDAEEIAENVEYEEAEDAGTTLHEQIHDDKSHADGDSVSMQLTLDEKLARERASDISKAFTLNDRFRFRRELFRNSDEEFKETLDVIASMSNMDEAEDYFYNDLCWDADNEDVKEFMAIVAKHF